MSDKIEEVQPGSVLSVVQASVKVHMALCRLGVMISIGAVKAGQCREDEMAAFVIEQANEMIGDFMKALDDKGFVLKHKEDA